MLMMGNFYERKKGEGGKENKKKRGSMTREE